jgi:hypothetical protein
MWPMAKLVTTCALVVAVGCGAISSSVLPGISRAPEAVDSPVRARAIARAQVWSPTNVRAMDIRTGPKDKGAFPFLATVTCDYSPDELAGASPKFECAAGDDELKVKYGGTNAEVYGEVAATRLMWALGFGADRMYPVRVICRGCPSTLAGIARENKEFSFDPATVERKMPGREFEPDSSWSWNELDDVDERQGGAPRAHRDALKLLAVFMQHTDTKPEQQRLVCLDAAPETEGSKGPTAVCRRPFMMVSDVGLTFGRANFLNTNGQGMNYSAWAATPVWKAGTAECVGNLPKSFTGTLKDPVISEEGRAFLANLLMQLSDAQIRALFEVSRATLRLRDPAKVRSGFATIHEWTELFKTKRAQIVERRC